MVICLERGADLHMAQLMPLPLNVSCFSKIQIGFAFLVPAHLGSPGKGQLNGCVCVCEHITKVNSHIRHPADSRRMLQAGPVMSDDMDHPASMTTAVKGKVTGDHRKAINCFCLFPQPSDRVHHN